MKKYIFTFIIQLLLLGNVVKAQSFQKTETGIITTIYGIKTEIQFFSENTVRIIKSPEGIPLQKNSLSVIAKPIPVKFLATQKAEEITIGTAKIKIKLNSLSGKISFLNEKGLQLLNEKEKSSVFTPFVDNGQNTWNIEQAFALEKEEAIYGLGQQQQGKMVQRNLTLNMVQGNTDDYIPFFQSAKGYGIFWDNYSPTTFTDNSEKTTFKSEVGDVIDYYFMYGENADGVIACMRNLTGQAPMFPLWTFGYFQSKERYKSQGELVGVVKKYRELGVPLDGIIQDWQYWGNNYLWNAMDFLNPEFENPQKMVNDVHALNAHMTISIWNSFGPKTLQYAELDKIGALMNFVTWPQSGSEKWPPNPNYPSGVKVYDPFNPEARNIYWKYLNKGIFSLGMDGWWMDSSEPDHLDFKPSDMNNKTFLGSFRKVRNAFPLMTVGGVYDHQREVSDAKRVFILTRSAFAGQQRYGANTWSGDVNSSWTALRNQISAGLNFSLTGIPYWNSDIGGFFLWNFRKKLNDPEYRELYLRWLQFGTFCPMMRSHGADAPREIFQFGKKGDKPYDVIEKYINLRYKLLPYIYSTSWQVTAGQSSMMRALVMDFASDKNALDINDQYLFGKSIMVCPVTKAMYVSQKIENGDSVMVEDFGKVKTKESYLPAGSDWYDFWTSEKISGGKNIVKETPIETIPLYVKAGAIIPFGPEVQYATEKKWDHLQINVYAGANGTFVLYEDENDNYNYEKGVYSTIQLNWDDKKQILTINDRNGSFPGMLEKRTFDITLITEKTEAGQKMVSKSEKSVSYERKKVIINFPDQKK
ncbi:MAG: DUF5110 domain-containing protein [Cytophagaceae bacterium]|nr:DUF5110 domain-containing protein [Cytophagaceae bacterium]MBL0327492.1 DUF5110 domain-containing protein [Cytophagaceae bacterium]